MVSLVGLDRCIDQLIAAARTNGKTLAAVLNRRFHPGMKAFKKAADDGRFGTLASASAYIKWFRDQAYYDSAGWRGTWALDGGGALMNQSIHTVDALIHLAGPVKSVQANTEELTKRFASTHTIQVIETTPDRDVAEYELPSPMPAKETMKRAFSEGRATPQFWLWMKQKNES